MRNLAGHEYSFVVAIGTSFVGANIMMPSGISTRRSLFTMSVFLFSSHAGVISSAMPRRPAMRPIAGLPMTKASEPPSTM